MPPPPRRPPLGRESAVGLSTAAAEGAALLSAAETLYLGSMDKSWNPVVVGACCAAIFSAMVAVYQMIGMEAPLTYGTAVVGGMFSGGIAAIITNLFPPKR